MRLRPHRPPAEDTGMEGTLRFALAMANRIVETIGAERVDVVTTTRSRVCLHPRELSDGEAIARLLGCDLPLDHRLLTPGYTLWTAERDGLEVQVRSALRGLTGGAR